MKNNENTKGKPSLLKIILIIAITIAIINIPLTLFEMSIGSAFNPIKRSHEKIRKYVLRIIPMDTDMEDVFKLIEHKEEWEIIDYSVKHGFPVSVYPDFTPKPKENSRYISIEGRYSYYGEKCILAHIGKYKDFFIIETDVEVAWCFDKNDKLIDVLIRKCTDTL